MLSSDDATMDVPQLKLPAELLAEVSRRKQPHNDFRVDGWKPSLLEKVARLLGLG